MITIYFSNESHLVTKSTPLITNKLQRQYTSKALRQMNLICLHGNLKSKIPDI